MKRWSTSWRHMSLCNFFGVCYFISIYCIHSKFVGKWVKDSYSKPNICLCVLIDVSHYLHRLILIQIFYLIGMIIVNDQ